MSETRICALCGRAFVILIPEGVEKAESDKPVPTVHVCRHRLMSQWRRESG